MISEEKEKVFIEVLEALRSHDVSKALEIIKNVKNPLTAAWIGMGIFYVIADDRQYTATFEEFRSELEKAEDE